MTTPRVKCAACTRFAVYSHGAGTDALAVFFQRRQQTKNSPSLSFFRLWTLCVFVLLSMFSVLLFVSLFSSFCSAENRLSRPAPAPRVYDREFFPDRSPCCGVVPRPDESRRNRSKTTPGPLPVSRLSAATTHPETSDHGTRCRADVIGAVQ